MAPPARRPEPITARRRGHPPGAPGTPNPQSGDTAPATDLAAAAPQLFRAGFGVREHPEMTATAAVGFRATGRRRHQRSARDPGSGIGKTCGDTVHQGVDAFATLPDGVGECDEVVLIGVGGKWTRVADQLPAAGSGDPTGMHDTEIPGMGLRHRREWSDDGCRVRIDEGQRRHGVVRAPWPAAATGSVHVRKIIVQRRRGPPDTRVGEARSPTVTISSVVQRNHRGSRRGRGMRGSLLPQTPRRSPGPVPRPGPPRWRR